MVFYAPFSVLALLTVEDTLWSQVTQIYMPLFVFHVLKRSIPLGAELVGTRQAGITGGHGMTQAPWWDA